MQRRRALALLSLAALVAGPVLLLTAPAAADVTGPCTATMNGADVNTIDTPGTALEVPYTGTVSIDVVSSGAITGHVVKLEPIGGLAFTADEGADEGNGWSGTVNVADYATYGVGIYKVIGSATGPGACSGTAFVKVTGKSPLTTVAGAAGAGLTAVGAVGVAASAAALRSRTRRQADVLFSRATEPEGSVGPEPGWDEFSWEQREERNNPFSWCGAIAISAFGLTLAYMVSGAGAPGASAFRPVRARPFVSIWASISSLLFGLGTLVLAQQFAVLYPTIVLAVVWLVVCVALGGVLVPSLIRLSAVRTLNARLAQAPAAAWAPTHRVPADGLDAWAQPDPASGEPSRLDPGLELRIEQSSGEWAKVSASNGWTGWVDGRRLERLA